MGWFKRRMLRDATPLKCCACPCVMLVPEMCETVICAGCGKWQHPEQMRRVSQQA